MNKDEGLLKIRYEHNMSISVIFLSVLITSFYVIFANLDKAEDISLYISIYFIFILFFTWYSIEKTMYAYRKLRAFYGDPKAIEMLKKRKN